MKNLQHNSLAWFFLIIALGASFLWFSDIETFIVFVSAIIVSKQIEILKKLK